MGNGFGGIDGGKSIGYYPGQAQAARPRPRRGEIVAAPVRRLFEPMQAGKSQARRHGNRAICTRKWHGSRAKRQIERNFKKSLDNCTATMLSSKHPKRHGNRAKCGGTLTTESRHGRNTDPEKPATIPSSRPRVSKYSRTTDATAGKEERPWGMCLKRPTP